MFCQSCGSKLNDGAAFCAGCGARAGGGAPQASQAPQAPQTVSTAPQSTIMVRDFRCNGCGSPLKIPANSRAPVTCPHCKKQCIIEGLYKNAEMAAKENINSGMSLTAEASTLHRAIVNSFCNSQYIPLDVFEKSEVIAEERYYIPGFCFDCNATTSFNYEVGVEKQQTYNRNRGDYSEDVTKYHTEWQPQSSTASVTHTLFSSANREFGSYVNRFYRDHDPIDLSDYDYLEFPSDLMTADSNLPASSSFAEYVKPVIDDMLYDQAANSIQRLNYRNLMMGGSNIQKSDNPKRVFFGMYRVAYTYNGEEYSTWANNDGSLIIYDDTPVDEARQAEMLRKQQNLAAISTKGITGFVIGCLACLIIGFIALPNWFLSVPLWLGAIVLGYFVPKRHSEKKANDLLREEAQRDLSAFSAQLSGIVQQFKANQKALPGIYQNLSGNPDAF